MMIVVGRSADAGAAALEAGRFVPDVQATSAPRWARASTMLSRVLSPLAYEALRRELTSQGKSLQETAIDAGEARFAIYVPRAKPARGYGLLVFIPPWDQAKPPPGWTAMLDSAGIILIIPAKAGNEHSVPARRIPLALLAYDTVAARFDLDPARVYVGGFSGGSRVALRLALDFPDLFVGALLNSGSDPIAEPPLQLPAADLLAHLQERSRIVFATGDEDTANRDLDARSFSSLRRWCIAATRLQAPNTAHEPLSPRDFERALAALDRPLEESAALRACRAGVARDLAAIRVRLSSPPDSVADRRRALLGADGEYGGLLAPDIVSWASGCGCGALPAAARPSSGPDQPRR